jgi:hypothetical protein
MDQEFEGIIVYNMIRQAGRSWGGWGSSSVNKRVGLDATVPARKTGPRGPVDILPARAPRNL